ESFGRSDPNEVSNRLTYADLNGDGEVTPGEIIEENNYYPFGLRHKGYNELATENPSGFKYKFGGKELNDELGFEVYDFGARNYDPALGRWMNVDPLAEEMRRFSPYNYVFNNPIFFIDPDGMAPFGFDKSKLDELEPIVDINETLAYEPEPVGMGLKKPTDPPGGGDDGETIDGGELEELFIDRRSITTKVGDAITGQLYDFAYAIYSWEQSLIPKGVSSGIYGPYIPDATSFDFSGGVGGIFFSGHFNMSIAMTNTDIAFSIGGDAQFGLNLNKPGYSLNGGLGFHDNYGGSTDVLAGLGGKSTGWDGNLIAGGLSRSQSALDSWRPDETGVKSTTVKIGPGIGGGVNRSQSEVYKLSNGIRNIKNAIKTWNF